MSSKLSLYLPVKPSFINKSFGDISNVEYFKKNGVNIIGYNGIAYQTRTGQGVYAAHDGICYPEFNEKQGNSISLFTKDKFQYKDSEAYFKTLYWHLTKDDIVVKTGQIVRSGELIGYADSSGMVNTTELHFGLKPILPTEPTGTWMNIEQTNGYFGAIDPSPYFNGLYAKDLNDLPSSTRPFRHNFFIPMKRGDSGAEILWLQRCLQSIGFYPEISAPNGIYGINTQEAVYEFQKKYIRKGIGEALRIWINKGSVCDGITLDALNREFGL